MKRIIKQVLYDTERSTLLIEVEALAGNRKLYVTKNGNFFSIEYFQKFVKFSKSEAQDFVLIHQDKFEPAHLKLILSNYFGINETRNPLDKALKIAINPLKNESLYLTEPGRQYYLLKNELPQLINESAALDWLEQNQDEINIEDILKKYFKTIKIA